MTCSPPPPADLTHSSRVVPVGTLVAGMAVGEATFAGDGNFRREGVAVNKSAIMNRAYLLLELCETKGQQ